MNSLLLVPLLLLAATLPLTASSSASALAAGLLRITYPAQNDTVPADKFIAVNGTSAPSNATHTLCNVQLQINQDGYRPVTPQGTGAQNYTKWGTVATEMMKVGHNEIEGQLMCFPPGAVGNVTGTANLLKHLTHNVTATAPSAHGITILNSTG
jgi:hypothetical protein